MGYRYADNGSPDQPDADSEEKDRKKKTLKRIKSRELRGGIMYYSCTCIKRNGMQHDCRRTGCQGEPPCLVLPDPVCANSQLARLRGLAGPLSVRRETHKDVGAKKTITVDLSKTNKEELKNITCCCSLIKTLKKAAEC
ncbi:uncharacterized protein LOC121730734 [Aricia agestis]|uniref:uncharacterized protein LOC121730734 n=1 Tax=Aricia agestis TaxID=91739 RepID=UPI001C202D1B|nr:uncharacterized protein LOC121730734 [Aricia agestis]